MIVGQWPSHSERKRFRAHKNYESRIKDLIARLALAWRGLSPGKKSVSRPRRPGYREGRTCQDRERKKKTNEDALHLGELSPSSKCCCNAILAPTEKKATHLIPHQDEGGGVERKGENER